MKTKTIIFIIVALALFIGLFFALNPKSLSQTTAVNPVRQEKTFEIVVNDRKIVSGPATLEANEGDNVIMKITVDEGGEVHLHGYNKMVELEKNVQGELSFTANLTGRFPFELEESGTEIGILEVMPK